MEAWNRLTGVRGEVGGIDSMKEGEENSQKTYIHSLYTQTTM